MAEGINHKNKHTSSYDIQERVKKKMCSYTFIYNLNIYMPIYYIYS